MSLSGAGQTVEKYYDAAAGYAPHLLRKKRGKRFLQLFAAENFPVKYGKNAFLCDRSAVAIRRVRRNREKHLHFLRGFLIRDLRRPAVTDLTRPLRKEWLDDSVKGAQLHATKIQPSRPPHASLAAGHKLSKYLLLQRSHLGK